MKRSALIVEFATLKRSFHSLEGASAPVLFVRLLLLVVQALMADGAVAPVDARMRVQARRAGRLEWSDDERATTRESTDVPCGEFLWDLWVHVRGQMLCFVVVEWSHAWCLLLSCSLTLAAFGPLSTRYGFPSGNSLTAPIDASATVTPVSCEVLLTCCVVHDYMYMY
jgi:hypothetical protein